MKIVGIDLAGSEARESALAILSNSLYARTMLLYTDGEIVSKVMEVKPNMIAIDAPLGLPKGRCCLEAGCSCAKFGVIREAERELLRIGIKVFSCGLPSMKKLTLRGIELRKRLAYMTFNVVETYPGAVQDLLRIPRKKHGLRKLQRGLIRLGIKGDVSREDITHHELDAITSAFAGKLLLEGKARGIGDPVEQQIVIPIGSRHRADLG